MESAKELITEKLIGLASEVTADDRRAARVELGLSDSSLTIYLRGDGNNVDTGLKLYEFFFGRIQERLERLKAITNPAA